jgi:hypothetical protein
VKTLADQMIREGFLMYLKLKNAFVLGIFSAIKTY